MLFIVYKLCNYLNLKFLSQALLSSYDLYQWQTYRFRNDQPYCMLIDRYLYQPRTVRWVYLLFNYPGDQAQANNPKTTSYLGIECVIRHYSGYH